MVWFELSRPNRFIKNSLINCFTTIYKFVWVVSTR